MGGLLLTSKVSDDFSLGKAEQLIPGGLENRVIRYHTNLISVDLEELKAFFKSYDHLVNVEGKSTRAVAEFFLDQFLRKLGQSRNFDNLTVYEGDPEQPVVRGGYRFEFIDKGKAMRVYDNYTGRHLTEIARLVEIRRGEERQVIICDPRVGRSPKKKFSRRIRAAKVFLEGVDEYTLSYMLVYSLDIFNRAASFNDVSKFLKYNKNNLCLVYSAPVQALTGLGQYVLELILAEQRLKDSGSPQHC